MKPTPSPLRHLQTLAVLIAALALWIAGAQGFTSHHHRDFQIHGDCAYCQVLGSSVSLSGAAPASCAPVVLTVRVTGPVTDGVRLPARLLRLRAPSTSPPAFPA